MSERAKNAGSNGSHGALAFLRRVPIALTLLRALLAPVVVLLAIYYPSRPAFGVCLTIAILSDIFDGILARRMNVATPNLRRLDSITDTAFYVCTAFAIWYLYPAVISQHIVSLAALVSLEAVRYIFDFYKFGREASYHMWSSKLWGIALFVGIFSLLVLGSSGITFSAAIYLGIIADIEGLAISVIINEWESDIPTFVHAYRLRDAKVARLQV
ncbi:MAG: CDP-alcohol phosphatidyltransferase family protein [Gemmatimonadaceae bacterium]